MISEVILVYNALVALWAIWALYWIGSFVYEAVKGQRKKRVKVKWMPYDILLWLSLVLALIPGIGQQLGILSVRFIPVIPILWYVGLVITALGLFFAIWARKHLGSNWNGIPALVKGQKLIRTGPYAIVRHPIYTGLLFGMIGSAITVGQYRGLIAIVLMAIFCWSRIRTEEKIMKDEFGKQYDTYKKEVKAIIPWIL